MKPLITNKNTLLAFGIIFFSHFFTTSKSFTKKEILILGGNGFIGSAGTVALLDNGHNITLLNRGNAYYDSDTRIKPHVSRHILCDREKSLNHTQPSKENEAIRPISPKRRRELQKELPYGDGKLACEETLAMQQREEGVPYFILRLPVAIGPRDTTYR